MDIVQKAAPAPLTVQVEAYTDAISRLTSEIAQAFPQVAPVSVQQTDVAASELAELQKQFGLELLHAKLAVYKPYGTVNVKLWLQQFNIASNTAVTKGISTEYCLDATKAQHDFSATLSSDIMIKSNHSSGKAGAGCKSP